jgi:hypothetical protein
MLTGLPVNYLLNQFYMIHQFIFAAPKPGMSEADFQDYWLNNHAINFAAKIPQIRKYKLDLTVPTALQKGDPIFSGIAEIWLSNDQEQLASMQTEEFLQGARLDEPNWAAFWKTLVLDTELAYDSLPKLETDTADGVKVVIISKRNGGVGLDSFRSEIQKSQIEGLAEVPNLKRFAINFVRDSWYFLGEPRFDLVTSMWFSNLSTMETALGSIPYHSSLNSENHLVNSQYRFAFYVKQNWIIGPDTRG